MIEIFYTRLGQRLPAANWDSYLSRLPVPLQDKINLYKRWEDRQAGLFGKLLLIEGLAKYGCSRNCLQNLLIDEYGRPFLDRGPDFNISHSGEYVVCAVTASGKVGIDIEKMRPVELADFEKCMTAGQWKEIVASDNRLSLFYYYWTIKESVTKADGRGLSLPLEDISGDDREALVHGTVWHVRKIDIDDRYRCHLATSEHAPEIRLTKISWD
jgi:4'-phosphopantetheinyl transferase